MTGSQKTMNKFYRFHEVDFQNPTRNKSEMELFSFLVDGWEILACTGGDRYARYLLVRNAKS